MEQITAKQQAIINAYGEYWEQVKEFVDDNGWCEYIVIGHGINKGIDYTDCNIEDVHFRSISGSGDNSWRPKQLAGIENNNGWIKIENEEQYRNIPNGHYHWFNINTARYEIGDLWCFGTFTHYQPINKLLPPIF